MSKPIEELTNAELQREFTRWDQYVQRAEGWGASLAAAVEFRDACKAEMAKRTSQLACPCCGANLSAVTPDILRFAVKGRIAPRIIEALINGPHSMDRLIFKVYHMEHSPHDEPEDASNVLRSIMSKMRAELEPYGYTIKSVLGEYHLLPLFIGD